MEGLVSQDLSLARLPHGLKPQSAWIIGSFLSMWDLGAPENIYTANPVTLMKGRAESRLDGSYTPYRGDTTFDSGSPDFCLGDEHGPTACT